MATIRKHRGKWQVQVRRKGCPKLTRTFIRKADALGWAHHTETEADRRGIPADPKALERLTIADLLARYRDTVVPSHRGHANEVVVIEAFRRKTIARTKLSEVSPSHFARYRDERLKRVRPATITRELGLIQHVFEVARREWNVRLPENPVKAISKPKPDSPRDRRLRDGEWTMILAECNRCRNALMKPLLRFAVETGMRRSELLNATWSDVSEKDSTLYIPHTKNGYARTIPLSPSAMQILSEMRGKSTDNRMIFPLSAEAVKLSWKRLTARAEIANLHFHDLRHEAITRFFEMGLTVPEVALISGHRDPRMLFRYTHLRAEDIARKFRSDGCSAGH